MAKAAKKATTRSRYFVQVDDRMLDFEAGTPAMYPIALSGAEAKAVDEDPNFFEVTKREFDRLANRIKDGTAVFVPRVKEEVKERTRGTVDIIWAVLLVGLGIVVGALLL